MPVIIAVISALTAHQIQAQRVLGPGDNARVLPKGLFELQVLGDWSSVYDRYSEKSGKYEPLGKNWNLDTLGSRQLLILAPVENALRSLVGNNALSVSLGATSASASTRITRVPIAMSAGISKRLTVGLVVPLVQTRSEVFFSTNPNGAQPNLALNPAQVNPAAHIADTAFVNQMRRTADAVLTFCNGSGATTPECSGSGSLVSEALAFAEGLDRVYAQGLFVPIEGGSLQQMIETRSNDFVTSLNAFSSLPGSSVPAITASGVVAANAPLTTHDIQNIVRDPAFGIRSDSIATISRWEMGDIELQAKFMLFESLKSSTAMPIDNELRGFNARISIGGMFRIPTGKSELPDRIFDASGSVNALGVGVRGYTDVFWGDRFWSSIIARYDANFTSKTVRRISDDPDDILLPFYRRAMVDRKPGNVMQLEITPRFVLNDFVAISTQYLFLNKQKDQYSGASFVIDPADSTGGQTITVNPATLGLQTGFSEHRIGGGITFSNLKSVARKEARVPFEVSYFRMQSISASGGRADKISRDWIQARLFIQIFGR